MVRVIVIILLAFAGLQTPAKVVVANHIGAENEFVDNLFDRAAPEDSTFYHADLGDTMLRKPGHDGVAKKPGHDGVAKKLGHVGIPAGRACQSQSRRLLAAEASFRGPVQEFIEATMANSQLQPEHLEVVNESHGQITDESHFHVLVVSKSFEGKSALQRHRLVNELLMKDGKMPFHALRITARTPEEWVENKVVPVAPECTGKGDGRGPTDINALPH